MYAGKPIIGIAGGIGSGKSLVAGFLAELGCRVIRSDDQVHAAYDDPAIRRTLRQWWGESVFLPDGQVDRSAIARRIFVDPAERSRLEQLLHPVVARARDRAMAAAADDPQVKAYVWDTPLLYETGLNRCCDVVVFVDAPMTQRASRVSRTRHWQPADLLARENSQLPLDSKRKMSDYVISNTAEVDFARRQVSDVFSRIVAGPKQQPNLGDGCSQAEQ
jgi:dephospho-CoA kinase